jgi:hypothetical protein
MRKFLPVVLALVVALTGCSDISANAEELRERITSIDIDAALDELQDCDALSERFVGLVSTAADAVDGLAETTDGRVPQTEIRRYVDTIAVNQYYKIAERIGCAQIQQRLRTIELLRDLNPDSPEGQEFLDQILDQVEAGV